MKLSIITITFNNLEGLRRTVTSVSGQTWSDFELLVVDGGSVDGTAEWLCEQEKIMPSLKWVSEPDNGVYDAQNKGISLARGEYCFFLNAGDCFASKDVLERMFANQPTADIVYGNEIVIDSDGKRVGYCKGVENPTMVNLYLSCMKHQASFIRRSLFERYGNYDSTLRIVADWEWFLRVIGFNNEVSLQYKDVDVSLFENTGISYHSPDLCANERQQVLDRYFSKRLQEDMNLLAQYPRLGRVSERSWKKWILRGIIKLLK